MLGELDLGILLKSMQPDMAPDTYVFAVRPVGGPAPAALLGGASPVMQFTEAEGETWVLSQATADRAGIEYTYPCRMITLKVHSSLEAVGFLAGITTALAAEGISVNPVSAFHHDHLFVPTARASDAMAVLAALADPEASGAN